MTPRQPRPELRLDAWGALAATLSAWVAYLVARSMHVLPDRGTAVVLLTVAPASAILAAVVLWARARADVDLALCWVAAGVSVGFLAMTLYLVSFPAVSPHGGPLGTSGTGSTLLYLLFHWSLALGALAGTWRVPRRWRPAALAVGVALVLAAALEIIPVPATFRNDQSYPNAAVYAELFTAIMSALVMMIWVTRTGRSAPALDAWVAVALSFNAYDVLLHTVSEHRYDDEWWASLLMRVATYTVLAVAAVLTVLLQLRRHEQYAESELTRRETELLTSLRARGLLLASAQALTGAAGETDVGRVIAYAATAVTGAPQATVGIVDEDTGALRILATVGLDQPPAEQLAAIALDAAVPAAHSLRAGQPVYTTDARATQAMFPDLAALPAHRGTAATAALPLRLATGQIGFLAITDDRERDWPTHERQMLTGIANQAAQALQRAHLFEHERATAEALQRGMLPRQLTTVRGVEVAARYLPGSQGLTVGGDWYDSIPLPDGRNVLVVGDVMGKGAGAAAVMGRARTAVHTMATLDPHPKSVLEGLDKIADELTPDGFFTLLYVLLDPTTGSAEIARAGHLPLLLAGPDGSARLIEAAGSPAVGLPSAGRASTAIAVPTGSTLALFTDGLVEDRTTGLDLGLQALVTAFSGYARTPLEDLADHLLSLDESVGAYDDVCLLLARLTARQAPQSSMMGVTATTAEFTRPTEGSQRDADRREERAVHRHRAARAPRQAGRHGIRGA